MPVAISKRLSSPWIRGGLTLVAGAVVLLFIGLLFPTKAAFFPLVSLWCSCILFYGVLWVLRVADVEFTLFHYAVLVACWAGSVVYFYWALGRREFIYAWDYVNYIDKQFHAEAALHWVQSQDSTIFSTLSQTITQTSSLSLQNSHTALRLKLATATPLLKYSALYQL